MPLQNGRDKKTCLIFQHGWGFDSTIWDGWRNFTTGFSCQFLDRGYWGRPVTPRLAVDCRNILITHSLGLHIATPWLADIDCLVIISGFEHFHGLNKAAGRFTVKHLRRMAKRLTDDAHGLLRDFYRDCKFSSPSSLNLEKNLVLPLLRDDLCLLDTGFAAIEDIARIPEILILHGADDRIVQPDRARELQKKLPASSLMFIPQAGHGLPFTHTETCWRIICDLQIQRG